MAIRPILTGAIVLFAFVISPPTEANNVNYNFNSSDGGWTVTSGTVTPPEKPWTWTPGPSVNEGGWQAWRGADPAQSGSYLVSPCFYVDDVGGSYVRMDIRHRFDFGDDTEASPLLTLGQVQYRVNAGDWLGIRTADFLATSGKIPPSYANPPVPLIDQTLAPPTGTYAVDAWFGTTNKFSSGDHQDSQFTLTFQPDGPYTFGPNDEIQFRFLVATQTPLSGTGAPVIDWEINKVLIDGVYECPEPGALALAGIGGLGCLILVRRRRRSRAAHTMLGSTAATVVAAIVGAWAMCAAPVRAGAVRDLALVSGTWTTGGEGARPVPSRQWMHTGTMVPLPPAMRGAAADSFSVSKRA